LNLNKIKMARAPKRKPKNSKITVVSNMPDYSKDPFFVKKAQRSKEFLDKHGFPEEWMPKK
jgi:hypothetical protein